MANEMQMPIVDISGSRYAAGKQLGQQVGHLLNGMVEQLRGEVNASYPGGWRAFCTKSKIYSAFVENYLAKDYAEMQGVQDGSGLPLEELFALTCLELREELQEPKGCTDFVVGTEGTANQHVYACHNEDWSTSEQKFLVIRRSHIDDEPESISVGYGGIIPSIGFNRNGIAVTGNALSPNDKKFGVPKLHIVREILTAENVHGALILSSMQPRASSFNNVLSTSSGQIYNFEGSANHHALAFSSEYSVHTNHYLADEMKRYEGSANSMESILRYNTMKSLVQQSYGNLTVETCKVLMGNHTNAPNSPCKHLSQGNTCTVFAAIIDLTEGLLHINLGNPCSGSWQTVGFE